MNQCSAQQNKIGAMPISALRSIVAQFRSIVAYVSGFGTRYTIYFDLTCFSIRSGWGTVENFGKRVLGLIAFVAIASTFFPIYTPAQLGQEITRFELANHEKQIQGLSSDSKTLAEKLAAVTSDQAVIKEQIIAIRQDQITVRQGLETMNAKAFAAAIGLVTWMGAALFNWLGGKARKKELGQ